MFEMREGKEGPYGDKLEWGCWCELMNSKIRVCVHVHICAYVCLCLHVFQFYLLKDPRSRDIPRVMGTSKYSDIAL